MNRKTTQAGFGLIEILITLVVLGVGLIAIANLQGKLFQNSAAARDRVAALNLAQQKLEDLRNFTQLEAGAGQVFGYQEIVANGGGMKGDGGGLLLASGDHTIGTTTYNLQWTVNGFDYGSDNQAAVASAEAIPDFKEVTLTVTWDGLDGGGSVEITGDISALSPSASALTLADPGDRQGPVVQYVPGAAPDYVPIDLGDGVKKETGTDTKVSKDGENTMTTINVVSYDQAEQTQRRDEIIVVNCTCVQSGTGEAMEPSIDVYDEGMERLVTLVNEEMITKRIGVPSGNKQPELCNTCCRDHHDSNASTYKYDPFRPGASSAPGGDHDHYMPDNNGLLQLANGAGDEYLEACRFKRVDGYLRLMPDLNLVALQVMPAMFVAGNLGNYGSYVQNLVEAYVQGINGGNYPVDYPAPDVAFPNEPLEAAMGVGQTDQYIARGIFIDYMDADLVAEIKSRIAGGEPFLGLVPFYEDNLTKFATWSSVTQSGGDIAATAASVSNEPLTTDKTNSRGFVTGLEVGTAYIQARIENDNTAYTDSAEIDPHTPVTDEAFHLADEIKLTVTADVPPNENPTVGGSISIANNVKIQPGAVTVTGAGGATCVKLTDASYSCVMDASGNGTIVVGGYNDTKTTGKTTTVNNNEVSPAPGEVAGANGLVINDGLVSETTIYNFNGVVGELVLNFTVN